MHSSRLTSIVYSNIGLNNIFTNCHRRIRPINLKNTNLAATMANITSSNTIEDLEEASKCLAPSLVATGNHKGSSGKVAVIGGSFEYTGAPYFASISALKVGADLLHVFCMKEAAVPIKCYSPELIVHPLLHRENLEELKRWLKSMDVILIGCGMGRKEETLNLAEETISYIKTLGKPLVIDADGLFLIKEKPNLLKDFTTPVILTPNRMEVSRFLDGKDPDDISVPDVKKYIQSKLWAKNVFMLVKGENDMVINCDAGVTFSGLAGSGRRCGGQGDILGGSLAVFLRWSHAFAVDSTTNPSLAACYAACKLTRECNRTAFSSRGRSMTAGDMIDEIHFVFEKHFERN